MVCVRRGVSGVRSSKREDRWIVRGMWIPARSTNDLASSGAAPLALAFAKVRAAAAACQSTYASRSIIAFIDSARCDAARFRPGSTDKAVPVLQ